MFTSFHVGCNRLIFFRDVEMTQRLNYSSAAALLGFSLIVAILRAFNIRSEAARVMVAAPLIAFVTTHILYLNCYNFDYGKILFWTYLVIILQTKHHPDRAVNEWCELELKTPAELVYLTNWNAEFQLVALLASSFILVLFFFTHIDI